MQLGAFSISLAVNDLEASRSFYEKLGFARIGGDGKGYLMMANGTTIIGLFQGITKGAKDGADEQRRRRRGRR